MPVLSKAVPRGSGSVTTVPTTDARAKVIDGAVNDWVGDISRYGGTYIYSNGELVYQDHLFDAHGADDGRDKDRLGITDPLADAVPETYRLDPLAQADAPGEFGVPMPPQLSFDDSYGDAQPHQEASDIEEVRVAIDDGALYLLVRTTTMTSAAQPGVLVLADTGGAPAQRSVPFDAGLSTDVAEHAVFLSGSNGLAVDLATETSSSLPLGSVSTQPEGFTNAVEARIPLELFGGAAPLSLAVATGPPKADGSGFSHLTLETNDQIAHPNVANVAFRTDEPVQVWFEKRQALALNEGKIDPFFLAIDREKLTSGIAETFLPGPGYHDRIFISNSAPQVVTEGGRNGMFQHYGVYLPTAYDGSPASLQWWLHWRGGNAHTAGSVIPRMFKHYGEEQDTIVISPSARGTSTWYVWKGHVDFLEVWADVFATFAIDRQRIYVSGHSMGGWGSYLMTVLYPDRFAAAAPVAGPVTQGAWTGLDFEGCDEFEFDGSTPCYVSVNGGRGRDQHVRKLLENVRHVPYAILQGTNDELVWYPGVARQSERLVQLGYRHRLYSYPGYEHYSHPIMDQWSEAAEYLHSFTNPIDPQHVTYKRDMPFERATEEVQAPSADKYLSLSFDSAYWMSGLTPSDLQAGIATFDGRSLAIPEEPFLTLPDAGGPTSSGTTGPFIATGLQWIADPRSSAPDASNGFDIDLNGASAVTLDLVRMDITIAEEIRGSVSTQAPLDLSLAGSWSTAPEVTVDGQASPVSIANGVLTIAVPAGDHTIVIAATQAEPTETPAPTPSGPVATDLAFSDTASTGQYSDEVTFKAVLTDDAGAPVADQDVTFELVSAEGRRSFTDTTDHDGVATVTTRLTERPGDAQLFASFPGNDDYEASGVVIASYLIAKEDSALALQVQSKGSKRTLVATLSEDDGAIPGRTIEFSADGDAICTAAPATDDEGRVSCDVPPRYQGGKRDYAALFPDDDYYLSSDASGAS